MNVTISMPNILTKASPVCRYGGIVLLILYVLFGGLAGFIAGVMVAGLCWIISLLCDAVVELYAQVEALTKTEELSKENT